jgi:hypothetical protein
MANETAEVKKFELDQNDRRSIRLLKIDQSNLKFQAEYTTAREIWNRSGFKGGLYNATLFSMAMRYQVKPDVEKVAVEKTTKKTPKKQLANA